MKKQNDPRHEARRIALMSLFEWSCLSRDITKIVGESLAEFAAERVEKRRCLELARGVTENLDAIDQIISAAAPEWPLGQISKIDLNVLRLAIFELLVQKEAPPKVAIDEAVELAKEFGGETSGSFVNGVLGTVVKETAVKDD